MRDPVLVLGVGGPAGFNVARAAQDAGYRVFGFDEDPSMLPLADAVCERTFHFRGVPTARGELAGVPLLVQPEALLPRVAELRDEGLVRWHGPSTDVLRTVKRKELTSGMWSDAGIGTKWSHVNIGAEIPDWLTLAKDRFGLPFWLRLNEGAGAAGAILVEDLRAAYHWIRLHEVKFGTEPGQFMAQEYLPGRDFCWTALYHEGYRVGSFARERLAWLYPRLAPFSGRTGTPTHSRVVHDRRVRDCAEAAVEVVDDEPHGVYCVDLREDEDGWPVPTEINAGRFATTSSLYHPAGPNLVAAQIRLANGDEPGEVGDDCYPEGTELVRHLDMGVAVGLAG